MVLLTQILVKTSKQFRMWFHSLKTINKHLCFVNRVRGFQQFHCIMNLKLIWQKIKIGVVEFLLKSYNCVHISIMCCHLDIRISKTYTNKHEALGLWEAAALLLDILDIYCRWCEMKQWVIIRPLSAKWPLITHNICHRDPAPAAAGHPSNSHPTEDKSRKYIK